MSEREQGQSLLLYLDDTIVFSSFVEQHLHWLELVLGRLQKEGLKVKLENCSFFQQEVGCLGCVISGKGVPMDLMKIEAVAVAGWKRPNLAHLFPKVSGNPATILWYQQHSP